MFWIGADIAGKADRDDSGAIVGSGEVGGTDLKVGDCFDLPEGDFMAANAQPCNEPHDVELVGIVTHPAPDDAPLPSEEEFIDAARTGCLDSFRDYVGISFQQSKLDMTTVTPAPDGWEAGDRQIQCVVLASRGKLDASVRDSER